MILVRSNFKNYFIYLYIQQTYLLTGGSIINNEPLTLNEVRLRYFCLSCKFV